MLDPGWHWNTEELAADMCCSIAAWPARSSCASAATSAVSACSCSRVIVAAPDATVELTAETSDETARIVVYDEGEGMDEELLEVAGEQPMSSRQGLGVGLFVGRAVLERLGGTMEIESAPGRGTRVTLRLPLVEPEAS